LILLDKELAVSLRIANKCWFVSCDCYYIAYYIASSHNFPFELE